MKQRRDSGVMAFNVRDRQLVVCLVASRDLDIDVPDANLSSCVTDGGDSYVRVDPLIKVHSIMEPDERFDVMALEEGDQGPSHNGGLGSFASEVEHIVVVDNSRIITSNKPCGGKSLSNDRLDMGMELVDFAPKRLGKPNAFFVPKDVGYGGAIGTVDELEHMLRNAISGGVRDKVRADISDRNLRALHERGANTLSKAVDDRMKGGRNINFVVVREQQVPGSLRHTPPDNSTISAVMPRQKGMPFGNAVLREFSTGTEKSGNADKIPEAHVLKAGR